MNKIRAVQMLGAYQIISQIGRGGMATVYKAYHASMDRYVAIKILPHEFMHDETFLGRFQQEVRLIAKLEHPRILPVYDYGESEGTPYLVMRYLDAGTLKERMAASPLSLDEVDHFFTQLAEGLAYAHKRGVIHRDIKPSNALVDEHGDIFLTDFGVAKLVEGSKEFTTTGAMTGAPAYMSPEQAQGQKMDQRTDIYSLGIVLYEMLTHQLPFNAETPMAVILKKLQQPMPPPSQFRADIHPAIEAVLLKALAIEPGDRFASIQDFLSAWKQALVENKKLEAERTAYMGGGVEAAKPAPEPITPKIASETAELPRELKQAMESTFTGVRAGVVLELDRLLHGSNPALAQKAYEALLRLTRDDSKQVSSAEGP
jgi:serine/threonine protein kinase